jgi:hypothetical protein
MDGFLEFRLKKEMIGACLYVSYSHLTDTA